MPATYAAANWQRSFFFYGTIVLIIASLYLAQAVILPIVLAVLIAFVLNPLLSFLQRAGLHRVVAVSLVVGLATLVFIGLIGAVGYQAKELIAEIPKYRANIVNKVNAMREASEGGVLEEFLDTVNAVVKTWEGPKQKGDPVEVKIQESNFWFVRDIAMHTLTYLVNAGLVLLLVFFILLSREDLRNRVIAVSGNLPTTTRALDEASQRVSAFLSMQFLVNASYGTTLAIGLYFLDVEFALIWGILSALLRYVPYIGPWIGAIFPIIISFATHEEWWPLVSVVIFIVVLELISNNVMEPWLYGRSIGVSEIALLVAAAFWTWLWGPLGLILSTPITACLVVFGRYVSSLRLIPHFLGNEKVLSTEVTFYQRLLAKDVDEATDLVEAHIKEKPVETVYDEILLPALLQGKQYQDQGDVNREDRKYILAGIRQIVDEVVEPAMDESHESKEDKTAPRPARRVRILGLSWDPAGETALYLLKSMMDLSRCDWRVFPLQGGWGEALDQVRREKPAILVIGAIQVKRLARMRTLCRRIKSLFPQLTILIHAVGQENLDTVREQMRAVGAEDVSTTFVAGWEALNDRVAERLGAEEADASNGESGNGARKVAVKRR